MKTTLHTFGFAAFPLFAAALLASCAAPTTNDDGAESADEELGVARDDLNGLWITEQGGVASPSASVIESWPAVGIRAVIGGNEALLTRTGQKLKSTSAGLALVIHPNAPGAADDVLDGTAFGQPVRLVRDTAPKPPITIALPKNVDFRSFLVDQIAPAAQRDRESYTVMHSQEISAFIHSCEAYKRHQWQYSYMAGADVAAESAALENIIDAVDGLSTSPRQLIHEPAFSNAVHANVRGDFLYGRAVSDLGLYFSVAAGRSLRMPVTNDARIYFITDRPDRAEKLGLVVTETPTHGLLATTFGRQLLELAGLPATDDGVLARSMMEMLTRSDATRATQLSPGGRSVLTDWYGVMAIEDYRGVAFGHPDLGWGYNFTNAQLFGLVAKALARPAAVDTKGKPVVGQVIVGTELRPGDGSYADVLNDGKDMQEYRDMAYLEYLAGSYLLSAHPSAVHAVTDAFAGVVPYAELDERGKRDVFHFVLAQLFDTQGRAKNLTADAARRATNGMGVLFDLLRQESAQLETYILQNGFTKSSEHAPK